MLVILRVQRVKHHLFTSKLGRNLTVISGLKFFYLEFIFLNISLTFSVQVQLVQLVHQSCNTLSWCLRPPEKTCFFGYLPLISVCDLKNELASKH